MAHLYADENFPLPAVRHLRELGHDVLTAHEAGQAGRGIPDAEVLKVAADLGRMVVTQDRHDFKKLHRGSQDHFGIIICRTDPDFVRLACCIDRKLQATPSPKGALLSVDRGG